MAFISDNIESEGYITGATISATTYFGNGANLIGIPYITGGTPNNAAKTYTFTNNTGGTFTVTGLTDITITGGTPNNAAKTYTLTNNTGGTFTLTGLTDITITGGTFTAGTTTFTNNTGGTFTVTGLSTCNIIFTQTQNKTVGNLTSEQSLFSGGSGTLTLPANFFVTGRTVTVTVKGFISRTSGNITFRAKLGSTTLATSPTASPGGVSSDGFDAAFDITCRSVGTGGTVSVQGRVLILSGANNFFELATSATSTIDTTISQTLDLTAQWSVANAGNTLTSTNATVLSVN